MIYNNYKALTNVETLIKYRDELDQMVMLIIEIALRTGMEISDIVSLTNDCLDKRNHQYYLQNNNHEQFIPINYELGNVLAIKIFFSIQNNNPENYVFVHDKGAEKGNRYQENWVLQKLNEFSKKHKLKDENGNPFYFSGIELREAYQIKMLNNSFSFVTVEQLLGNDYPELTFLYDILVNNNQIEELHA